MDPEIATNVNYYNARFTVNSTRVHCNKRLPMIKIGSRNCCTYMF